MLRIAGITHDHQVVQIDSLERLSGVDLAWYWVDFNQPTADEMLLLGSHFHFHPLAIEDCYHLLQRPKLDHYDSFHFFVLHAMKQHNLTVEEVNLFLGKRFIVTYHTLPSEGVDHAWEKLSSQPIQLKKGPLYAVYVVIDKLVDQYFPAIYELEDQIADIENQDGKAGGRRLMNELFDIRSRLLKLRKTIVPMRELLYRIINSDRIEGIRDLHAFFTDVHDHLLKLSEMIESNRELSADIRDNYISMNSDRMNNIMKTLTVITTIFMPLTFLAGIYGMNFRNMPELNWNWGYFALLGVMGAIGLGMYLWFRRKGWFD